MIVGRVKGLLSLVLLSLGLALCGSCSSRVNGLYSQHNLRSKLIAQADSASAEELLRSYFGSKGIKVCRGNSLVLLESAQAKFADLFTLIRQAQRHIHLEYFNLRNDSISHTLFRLLRQKAEQGLQVRVLFDAFGNMSNDRPLSNRQLDSLKTLGISIHKFDPIRFPWVNHILTRDHRKLAIIDGEVAYLGGMNIADYYLNGKENIGAWRDMHCRIEGTAVVEIQKIFADMWYKVKGERLTEEHYFPTAETYTSGISLSVVDRSPRLQPDAIKDSYALAIAGAKREVNIVNPYFVPTRAIMSAIDKALKRGVCINIMVSAVSDIPFTPEAMLHKLRRLSKKGAKVYLYTDGFHHAKFMTIDGHTATLGSANLNSRSLRYDYETNVFIFDRGVTYQLDSIYRQDKQQSIPLDDRYWAERSVWKKFLGCFANLFTFVL